MPILDLLESIASDPPDSVTASINYRLRGSTKWYEVSGLSSLNHYTGGGAITWGRNHRQLRFLAGSVVLFPPDTGRRFQFDHPCLQRVIHFRPTAVHPASEPMHWPAGPASASIANACDSAIAAANQHRKRAAAWSLLWALIDLERESHHPGTALVERAQAWIRRHLAQAITVAEVAKVMGCAHNTLTRCFRQVTGGTVVAWIRAERVRRAADLLRTTTLPIGAVAAEVGIPDRQHFNKTMRRELGMAPSRVRYHRPVGG